MEQRFNSFFITSCGRVWSFKRNKFVKITLRKTGYYQVRINDKIYLIHRLVAETYIPNPDNLDTVDHINGDKSNNCINNLQWLSREDNARKGVSKKVKCVETGEIFESITLAAKSINRAESSLSIHLAGKTKSCGKLHWKYI